MFVDDLTEKLVSIGSAMLVNDCDGDYIVLWHGKGDVAAMRACMKIAILEAENAETTVEADWYERLYLGLQAKIEALLG